MRRSTRLANEAGGPVGRLLGIPADGADATVSVAQKRDISAAKGKMAIIEAGDWGNAGGDSRVNLKSETIWP